MVHTISKYIIAWIHLSKLTSKVLSAYVGGSWIIDSDLGNRLVFLIKLKNWLNIFKYCLKSPLEIDQSKSTTLKLKKLEAEIFFERNGNIKKIF